MSLDLKNLELIYERYYEILQQINELIERGMYSELAAYISKKEMILQEAKVYADRICRTGEDASDMAELCKKIHNLEKANIDALTKIKDEIQQELHSVNKDSKLKKAYALSASKNGGLLDFKE